MKLKIDKILVPTDFSDLSISALHYAGVMAKKSDAKIILLHVMEMYEHNVDLNRVINVNDALQKAINEKLTQIKLENIELWGVEIESRLMQGKIHKGIQQVTNEEQIDLIVMGTHGATGITDFGRFILGSNASRIVSTSKCPVLTIRKKRTPIKFEKIVLPLDMTPETTQKVGDAIKLAKVFNSTIHAISVSSFFDEFRVNIADMTAQLKDVANKIVKEGITCKTKMIRHDNVSSSVLDYAEGINADLILIMARMENGLNEFLIGSGARTIINESNVPVLSFPVSGK